MVGDGWTTDMAPWRLPTTDPRNASVHWEELNKILGIMAKSLEAIMHLGLLCILCIFIYALMGTQFYAKQLEDENGDSPRSNFDHIGTYFR